MFIKELPKVFFGKVEEEPFDWRKVPTDSDEEREEDAPASSELIAMLGFDPDEEDYN